MEGGMHGGAPAGGTHWMRQKPELEKARQPRILTASEIRLRVEDIAEEMILKMRPEGTAPGTTEAEAFPLDTGKFVRLMSDFLHMN